MTLSDWPTAGADDAPGAASATGDEAPVMRPALPILDDAARSPDPAVCPFFRFELEGDLVAPLLHADEGNRCAAIGSPRPQSSRQQELVCLKAAHADCPRYLRGAMALQETPTARRSAAVPRATLAALLILVLSAGISFGFVVQRGGIQLPVVGGGPASTEVALAPAASAATTAEPTSEPTVAASPSVVAGASASPSALPSPSAPPSPSASPSPTPTLAPSPTASPEPTPKPTPKPTRKPTSDRYKLLEPCPDRNDCYIYTVRSGDNLYSIAHYFGISLSTIYRWNPQYPETRLKVGAEIRMPPPTR